MIHIVTAHPQDPNFRGPSVTMKPCNVCKVWWPSDDLQGHECPDCIEEAQKKADAIEDEQWNKMYNP